MIVDVDSALLAVPNFAIDPDEAEILIERVRHFAAIALPSHPCSTRIWSDTEAFLWGNSVGPDHAQIEQFLDLVGLDIAYSVNDLFVLYNTILSSAERVDELVECDAEISEFACEPVFPPYVTPVALVEQTKRNFINCISQKDERPKDVFVASPFAAECILKYSVSAKVVSQGGEENVIVGSVDALSHIADLASAGMGLSLWQAAEEAGQFAFAISVGVRQACDGNPNLDIEQVNRFAFTEGFFESLTALGATGSGVRSGNLYRILVSLVLDECTSDKHEYGQGGSLVRQVDGSVGWRLHVTKSHEALRLMYWKGADFLEFANLEVKHNIRIAGQGKKADAWYSASKMLDL